MKIKNEIKVGIVVIGAISILIYGLFFLKGINLFDNNRVYFLKFEEVYTPLVPGSAVMLDGQKVGIVRHVDIDNDIPTTKYVEIIISDGELKIPTKTTAELSVDFMGTSSINLTFHKEKVVIRDTVFNAKGGYIIKDSSYTFVPHEIFNDLISPYDTIKSDVKQGLMDVLDQRLLPIEQKVNVFLGQANQMMFDIQSILNNNSDNLNSSFSALANTMKNFEVISTDFKVFMANEKGKISSLLTNISEITTNLKNSNDKVKLIVDNFASLSDSIADMDVKGMFEEASIALEGANKIIEQINTGQGSLGQLVYSDSLMVNVNAMLEEATRLIENMKEHPKRYVHFSLFGKKEKGLQLDKRDEKILKDYVKDSLREKYNQ